MKQIVIILSLVLGSFTFAADNKCSDEFLNLGPASHAALLGELAKRADWHREEVEALRGNSAVGMWHWVAGEIVETTDHRGVKVRLYLDFQYSTDCGGKVVIQQVVVHRRARLG